MTKKDMAAAEQDVLNAIHSAAFYVVTVQRPAISDRDHRHFAESCAAALQGSQPPSVVTKWRLPEGARKSGPVGAPSNQHQATAVGGVTVIQ